MSFNYEELDPGIRDVVETLHKYGFETTDSGDGVSKPAHWYQPDEHGITQAFDFPHVVCATTPQTMLDAAYRLQWLLGDEWSVEATYYAKDRTAILFAGKTVDA